MRDSSRSSRKRQSLRKNREGRHRGSPELADHPPGLIRAILAGLDPDVPANDPSIIQAEQALVAVEGHGIGAHHPTCRYFPGDSTGGLQPNHQGNNAAIVWLTAADTLPLMRLGNEEPAVRRLLERLARRTKNMRRLCSRRFPMARVQGKKPSSLNIRETWLSPLRERWTRENLLHRVAAAITQTYRGTPVANPNRYAPHQHPGEWSWDFADRLRIC